MTESTAGCFSASVGEEKALVKQFLRAPVGAESGEPLLSKRA